MTLFKYRHWNALFLLSSVHDFKPHCITENLKAGVKAMCTRFCVACDIFLFVRDI